MMLPVPINLTEKLHLLWGWYKTQSGYDASTAAQWTRNVGIWGKLLEGHPEAEAFIQATKCMCLMVLEAMLQMPDVDRLKCAAKGNHKSILTTFPIMTLHIYEHALLCHVPDVLTEGSLLDRSLK
jgi:hypothetical protein